MILSSYNGLRDGATDDDIHIRDCTAMYCTDNNIFFCDISHTFSGSASWVHAKCAFKTHDRRLAYNRIYKNLFGRNALVNSNATCEATIGHLDYHVENKNFNWEKYTNLHVEQNNIKTKLTTHGFND